MRYEENPVNDSPKATTLGGGTIAVSPPNYLEQLAQEMAKQRELLNMLDSRLDIVSERAPQEPTEPTTDRVHVSAMVGVIRRNNRDIERLINELAI